MLSGFLLKVIAIICMLSSHISTVLGRQSLSVFLDWPIFIHIGTIAFPIFAYMISQGCIRTKNINKYLLRLGIFAIISEIPFDLAFNTHMGEDGIPVFDIDFLINTNIFYTLFLGVACVVVYENLKTKECQWVALFPVLIYPLAILVNFTPFAYYGFIIGTITSILSVVALFFITHFLPNINVSSEITISRKIIPIVSVLPMLFMAAEFNTDYGIFGVALIFILYLSNPENKVSQMAVLTAGIAYHYGIHIFSEQAHMVDGIVVLTGSYTLNKFALYNFIFALISVLIIFLYNGKQGLRLKWAFYLFYPVHLMVLTTIWYVSL